MSDATTTEKAEVITKIPPPKPVSVRAMMLWAPRSSYQLGEVVRRIAMIQYGSVNNHSYDRALEWLYQRVGMDGCRIEGNYTFWYKAKDGHLVVYHPEYAHDYDRSKVAADLRAELDLKSMSFVRMPPLYAKAPASTRAVKRHA